MGFSTPLKALDTSRLTLSFIAILGAVSSPVAQDQFPDVPENHWATKSLAPENPVIAAFAWLKTFILENWTKPLFWVAILAVVGLYILLSKLLNNSAQGT